MQGQQRRRPYGMADALECPALPIPRCLSARGEVEPDFGDITSGGGKLFEETELRLRARAVCDPPGMQSKAYPDVRHTANRRVMELQVITRIDRPRKRAAALAGSRGELFYVAGEIEMTVHVDEQTGTRAAVIRPSRAGPAHRPPFSRPSNAQMT